MLLHLRDIALQRAILAPEFAASVTLGRGGCSVWKQQVRRCKISEKVTGANASRKVHVAVHMISYGSLLVFSFDPELLITANLASQTTVDFSPKISRLYFTSTSKKGEGRGPEKKSSENPQPPQAPFHSLPPSRGSRRAE